jgi:hypothetical protein
MNELIIILTLFYILPTILSVIVIYHKEQSVTVGEFIEIVFLSMIPAVNIFVGYLGGMVVAIRSSSVNNFLNKKLK